MPRKDYAKFANLIREYVRFGQAVLPRGIAYDLAKIFQEDNPGFDRQRFLEACNILA